MIRKRKGLSTPSETEVWEVFYRLFPVPERGEREGGVLSPDVKDPGFFNSEISVGNKSLCPDSRGLVTCRGAGETLKEEWWELGTIHF